MNARLYVVPAEPPKLGVQQRYAIHDVMAEISLAELQICTLSNAAHAEEHTAMREACIALGIHLQAAERLRAEIEKAIGKAP